MKWILSTAFFPSVPFLRVVVATICLRKVFTFRQWSFRSFPLEVRPFRSFSLEVRPFRSFSLKSTSLRSLETLLGSK